MCVCCVYVCVRESLSLCERECSYGSVCLCVVWVWASVFERKLLHVCVLYACMWGSVCVFVFLSIYMYVCAYMCVCLLYVCVCKSEWESSGMRIRLCVWVCMCKSACVWLFVCRMCVRERYCVGVCVLNARVWKGMNVSVCVYVSRHKWNFITRVQELQFPH